MPGHRKALATIRWQIYTSYQMGGEHDLMVYASHGTYFQKGERFVLGLHIYEVSSRRKTDNNRWEFACKEIRQLTEEEYVQNKRPPRHPGEPWPRVKPPPRTLAPQPRPPKHQLRCRACGHRLGLSLTPKQVRQIRKALKKGAGLEQLAKKYGVRRATIYNIRNGKNWSHLP